MFHKGYDKEYYKELNPSTKGISCLETPEVIISQV